MKNQQLQDAVTSPRHTKGPWLDKESQVFDGDYTITTLDRLTRFKVEIATIRTDWDEPFASEQLANVRLIASAPDLLAERDRLKALNAELVEALEFVEGLYSHEARAAENSMALYEACCMARAALAKHKKETA